MLNECDHISKVLKWGVDAETSALRPSLWGCTNCDIETNKPFEKAEHYGNHQHKQYVEGCFVCKVRTLSFDTGDANGNMVASGWTRKKWDGELQAYRDARAQGIQPKSTKMKDIQAAVAQSDKTGTAFQA